MALRVNRECVVLEFQVIGLVQNGQPWPQADASVIQICQEKAAMRAARRLVEAYRRGEESDGSTRREGFDLAYEVALEALGQDDQERSSKN